MIFLFVFKHLIVYKCWGGAVWRRLGAVTLVPQPGEAFGVLTFSTGIGWSSPGGRFPGTFWVVSAGCLGLPRNAQGCLGEGLVLAFVNCSGTFMNVHECLGMIRNVLGHVNL